MKKYITLFSILIFSFCAYSNDINKKIQENIVEISQSTGVDSLIKQTNKITDEYYKLNPKDPMAIMYSATMKAFEARDTGAFWRKKAFADQSIELYNKAWVLRKEIKTPKDTIFFYLTSAITNLSFPDFLNRRFFSVRSLDFLLKYKNFDKYATEENKFNLYLYSAIANFKENKKNIAKEYYLKAFDMQSEIARDIVGRFGINSSEISE